MIRRGLRRLWRRLLSRLHPRRVRFVYSSRYLVDVSGIPYDPRRGENILTFLAQEGLLHRGDLHWPRMISLQSLCRVHSEEYLEALSRPGSLLRVLGLRVADADEDHFLAVQRTMVGGTVKTTRLALEGGGLAVNLGGGLHHAHRDSGRGFCVFNDVAVAISEARHHGFTKPVLVIDLDLHDGDGTRALFAEDPSVYTFSIHNQDWDDRQAIASTRLALGDDVEDDAYLSTLRETLPPVIEQVRPGLVYYLAGCDPAADDRLGNWKITAAGMLERDRFVIDEVRRQLGKVPLAILLAGGYGKQSWRYSARFFSSLMTAGGGAIEPPSTNEITLARYRYHASLLRPADLTSEPDDNGLGLTEEDLFPGSGGIGRESRFLGYYSPHGVELALERYGFLARLRQMGFSHPSLELELNNPAGQTLRVFGDEHHEELLVELRARRDRRTVQGAEVLFVEWLMLQNPRESFSPRRPRLPGQKKPGLGFLRDVMALLVLICERLDLAGIAFVPSHFHLAAQSERYLRFLKPEDQARFLALCQVLSGQPLAMATRLVAEGRVRDRKTGKIFTWKPAPMVMPVAESLQEQVEGEAYKRRVAEFMADYDLELLPEPAPA